MTNKLDTLDERIRLNGLGEEETAGVTQDGFTDPSGEYPKKDYSFSSNINKASKGEKVNELDLGGSDLGIELDVSPQRPSVYPHNKVQETSSGHIIEIDDTPGAERLLVKHRSGSGVQLSPDGSIIVVSKKHKIEVVAEDETTIIEGDGKLVYKGNLNLSVTGDYNVDVGGNYSVNVSGDKRETIKGRHTKVVDKDQNYTIRGSRGSQVAESNTDTILGDNNLIVKGNNTTLVQGNIETLTASNMIQTAVNEWTVAASVTGITARHASIIAHKGTIGGSTFDFYGKTYGGMPGTNTNLATFYGTLVGRATEANHADYAIKSSHAEYADSAKASLRANKEKPTTISGPSPKAGIMTYLPLIPTAPLPNPAIVETQLSTSSYGIRNVEIDPEIGNKISKSDEYDNLFNFEPSIHEIRSKLRDPKNFENEKFTSQLVSENKLNRRFKNNIPKNIGRSAGREGSIQFGENVIGNNPADSRTKRFKLNTQ